MQIDEARRRQSEQASVIDAGLTELDLSQVVEFCMYNRIVLPLDGYVFWQPAGMLKVAGALHHTMEMFQNEDETLGLAHCTFTTFQHVQEFTCTPINTIYVARQGGIRYAFSAHAGYLQELGLWHYQGRSIIPAMESQLLDDPSWLNQACPIVSNSLPIWLAFNGYTTPYVGGFSNPVTLYPSKAVPANLPPPYGAVHIEPAQTRALQQVPQVFQITETVNGEPVQKRIMSQLAADRVHITLYGLQNDAAMEFYGALLEYIGPQGPMGLMNNPILQDGKREQVELQALAMQKFLDVEVSYHQFQAKAVALQLLKSASVTFYLNS